MIKQFVALLSLVVLGTVGYAQTPEYYYQGRHKVKIEVQTDTLALKTTAPLTLVRQKLSAGLPSASMKSGTNHEGKINVHVDAKSVDQLNAQAAAIRAVDPETQPQAVITNPSDSDSKANSPKYLTTRISFKVSARATIKELAARYHLENISPVPYATNAFTADVSINADDLLRGLKTANTMQESGDADWASPLIEEKKALRYTPNDPFVSQEWHLNNTGSNTVEGVAGNDLDVFPAWDTSTGAGVNIAINDEGVETAHPDLIANARTDLDYDFNDNDDDPTPSPAGGHGTSCAGVAAGKGNNGIGISGVAPDAGLVGLRILAAPVSDDVEGQSLAWKASEPYPENQVSINSDSWGPEDSGTLLEGPGPLAEAALKFGATVGRSGNGIVYTWAAGNGRASYDNMNKDGYANNPYVIAVGASNSAGTYAWYSEPGAAMLVNAPSSHYGDSIFTTDNTSTSGSSATDYRSDFGGTSSAAPAVAGAVALILQANPELTYRDVMHILVETTVINDPTNSEWHTNGAGLPFNHNYGFGRVDCAAAVAATTDWDNVPPLEPVIESHSSLTTPLAIPDNNATGITMDIPVTAPADFNIEHVELEADITHTYRSDLVILLESPSGMTSELIANGLHGWYSNDSNDDYDHWRFRSVAHWGEHPSGTWKLHIADYYASDTGTLNSYTLRITGYRGEALHRQRNAGVDGWELYD